MKNFAQAKRLCASTVFLVSIIVAIVIAKETHQKDSLNPVDHVVVNKEPRGWRGVCHSGKCGRRRSGKRGMKLVRGNTFRLFRKSYRILIFHNLKMRLL